MAFLMYNDAEKALGKAKKAMTGKDIARRSRMTRLEIFEEYAATHKCSCDQEGECYRLVKETLRNNGFDGILQ